MDQESNGCYIQCGIFNSFFNAFIKELFKKQVHKFIRNHTLITTICLKRFNLKVNNRTKLISWIFIFTLLVYIGVCGYFFTIQEKIIFNLRILDADDIYEYSFEYNERWFEPEENVRIHAIHAFTDADTVKGLVMYLHGNRGSNRTNGDRYRLFLDYG